MSRKNDLHNQISSLNNELELSTLLNKGALQDNKELKLRVLELERENTALRVAESKLARTEDRLEEVERLIKEKDQELRRVISELQEEKNARWKVESEELGWKERWERVMGLMEGERQRVESEEGMGTMGRVTPASSYTNKGKTSVNIDESRVGVQPRSQPKTRSHAHGEPMRHQPQPQFRPYLSSKIYGSSAAASALETQSSRITSSSPVRNLSVGKKRKRIPLSPDEQDDDAEEGDDGADDVDDSGRPHSTLRNHQSRLRDQNYQPPPYSLPTVTTPTSRRSMPSSNSQLPKSKITPKTETKSRTNPRRSASRNTGHYTAGMGNQSGEGGVGVGVVGSHGVKVEYESSAEDESDDDPIAFL